MKILQITEASSGGVGRHTLDLSAGLMALGCEVHLLHGSRRMDGAFQSSVEQLPGLHHCQVDMRRAPHPSDWHALRQIQRYIRRHGPYHVIHGQSSKGGALARMLGQGRRSARVYTPHCVVTMSPNLDKLRFHTYRLAESILARYTDALITVSPEEQQHLLALGFDSRRLHCIPNGIQWQAEVERETCRAKLGLNGEHVLIGFLGRLSPQKNPRLLIDAFARIASRQANTMLAMVGQGEMEAELRALVNRHGIQDRVLWLGFRRPEEVLPAFDIFALSSDYEAMPYVLLEALAAGLPIVATRVGGTALTVEPDRNGLLVDSFTAGDFAAALEVLAKDESRRQRMGEVSRGKAGDFQISGMVRRTHDLYCRLLKAPLAKFSAIHSLESGDLKADLKAPD